METCLISGSDLRTLIRAASAHGVRTRRLLLTDERDQAELRRLAESLERAEQSLEDAKARNS